ncbi:polymorphic toxin type 37 domain-containing protein [Nocardia alni]|uniref:polymorphic toxin type 37 domain-containing protein n=1 Tax=Nocardia alni TaxID=2815723 RepID=UPI001C24FF27|nr:polymorphic toxin type 37 domain-containing protein [Nocardia alni]
MIVDWQTYYDAGRKCHDLADELRAADKPVHAAVKGDCAGMAGDAPGCEQWGQAYDKAAQQTMQACSSLANALTNYGAALQAMGYNYGLANNSKPAPDPPNVSQVGEYQVTIPSSVADNGIGFTDHGGVKEFFDKLVAKVLSAFGKLPNGDATKLDKAHTTWNTFATHPTITAASGRITAISALFDGMDDATNRQLLQDHFATLKTGADTVSTAATNMAAPVGAYHDATVALGAQTAGQINTLELTIGLTAIAGGLLALFSLGTSAVVAEAAIDADVLATADAIQTSYRASQMTRVIGLTSLAAGAVGAIDAFHALPTTDLDKAIKSLEALILMKVVVAADGALEVAVSTKPPANAYDPNGAKAPGRPDDAEGFTPPKGGDRWVPAPNGRGFGWEDAGGNVWVPTGPGALAHGGPHWDVQEKSGGYTNVYPGGATR